MSLAAGQVAVLAEGEHVGPDSGRSEGDLYGAVADRALLPYELIQAAIAEQAAKHALRFGVYAGNGQHPLTCGAQDAVLGDVSRELVVPDLQRERQPMVAVQLLAFAQSAAMSSGTLSGPRWVP